MFRFAYALAPSERLDEASLRVEEFDAFEAADGDDHGVSIAGRRCTNLAAAIKAGEGGVKWASYRPEGGWREVVRELNAIGGDAPSGAAEAFTILIEPWTDCTLPRELWQLIESVTNRRVRIAWSAEWGAQAGISPAAVVPVLNLRIGAVRVADAQATTIEFAKRLAGIGFEGYLIVDPPASEDRLGEARKIAEIVRDVIQPRKPVKPAAKKA